MELHVMAGRLQAAKRAAAERGELRTPLPVGYLYDPHGEPGHDVMVDPDAEVHVFGRYSSRRTVDADGTVRTTLVEQPRSQWPVLIKDHHEGYITWDGY